MTEGTAPEAAAVGGGVDDRGDTVCVIGAGGTGLAAVKNLREAGFDVDCYERETGVGGAWNWRHDRSPVYASTHLISSKPFTQFPDFPMPDDWPDYPHHSRLLEYFERYADHFGLREHIWFGTEVVAIAPVDGDRWDVTVRGSRGGAPRTLRYAAVVAANGHNWSPKVPAFEGLESFRGTVIHASAYKDAAQLRGRRVLVVGAGNTGCDLAVEAAQQAARCWHSTRRGYWYAPKYALGRPADQVNDRILALGAPLRVRQWLFHRTMKLTVGELTRFGLPAPDHRVYETHPIVNSQLVYYVGHGGITPVPDVARFDRTEVVFADGSTADPDLVVLATGYLPRFEFAAPQLLGAAPESDGGQLRPRLALQVFSRSHPTLAVAGLVQPDSAIFTIVHWQTVAIARWLRLRRTDPERARTLWAKLSGEPERRFTEARVKDSTRHWFEISHVVYLKAIQRLVDQLDAGGARTEVLRPAEWSRPVASVRREVLSAVPDGPTDAPPVLFVPGFGAGAWVFAEHWLERAAERGFPAYALSPRGHGGSGSGAGASLRAYVHDVTQVAAGLPRQAVLVGHGAGALVAAAALARYPARAGVLVAPVFGGLGAGLRALLVDPVGTLPGLVGGPVRVGRGRLFGRELPAGQARAYAARTGRASARAQWGLLAGGEPEPPVGDPPVLVLGSPDDRVVSGSALAAVARRYGTAPLLFPGMGHAMMLDARWQEPLDAILDWLAKQPPR